MNQILNIDLGIGIRGNEILTKPYFSYDLPRGAKILSVTWEVNRAIFWYLSDIRKDVEERKFRLVSTGDLLIKEDVEDLKFICTFQVPNTLYTFHLFEIIK